MKKYLFSWMTIVLMTFVCVGFVACGSDDDDNSSSSSQLIGTWYQYDNGYIQAFCFNSDGTGWKGEWKQGRDEEHRGFTWKVNGNNLQTFNIKDGDMMDNDTFSISADGKTLTLKDAKDGRDRGVFTKQ